MLLSRSLAASLLLTIPLIAQLAPPNREGVSGGHIHLNAADPDAAIKFWKDVIGMGGYSRESLNGVSTQGVIILFTKAAPSGPGAGSVIDHIAFQVPDLQPVTERLAKTSYKGSKSSADGDRLMIEGPDGVRIELLEDNSMYATIEFSHIALHTSQPKEMQAWYAKNFGARSVTDEKDHAETGEIPGAKLVFEHADSAAPSAGRPIDHIGFEVKGLEAYCAKLAASGIKLDSPYRQLPQLKLAIAFLTDPWGTRIELTEGLAH